MDVLNRELKDSKQPDTQNSITGTSDSKASDFGGSDFEGSDFEGSIDIGNLLRMGLASAADASFATRGAKHVTAVDPGTASGAELIETVVGATGFEGELQAEVQSELESILKTTGFSGKELTLDDLRASLLMYMEALGQEYFEEAADSSHQN